MVVHHTIRPYRSGFTHIVQMMLPFLVVAIGLVIGYSATRALMSSATAHALSDDQDTSAAQSPQSETLGAQTTTASPQPAATPTASAPTTSSPVSPAASQKTPSSCSTSNYLRPAAPALSAPGVTVSVDTPTYYTIGTDQPAELSAVVHDCGRRQPNGSGYDASTSYNLAWSYSITQLGNNSCRLDDVRVGIRINQLLPTLDPTRPVAVQTLWNSLSGKLYSHEQQHVAIDSNGARSLYAVLSTMSGPCDTIDTQARNAANAKASYLQSDNDALDSSTNHGQL